MIIVYYTEICQVFTDPMSRNTKQVLPFTPHPRQGLHLAWFRLNAGWCVYNLCSLQQT